jgi:mRNA-degrading endonuclease RelE of RelBE toxin-antitoxin system
MMMTRGRKTVKLRVPQDVRNWVSGAHPHIKRKLRAALEHIQSEPEAGKALRDELLGLRSYRIGRLRIIYRTRKPAVIEIVAIGPRKTIYEETFRLLNMKR